MKSKLKLATRGLHWVISSVILILLITITLTLIAPNWLSVNVLKVAGGSMEPTIPLGSLAAIQPVDIETILPGDIITFQSPEYHGAVVTHRVVEVTVRGGERAFRTQGDANEDPDLDLVPASKVLGRVLFSLPYLGSLTQFIRTRYGWFLLVIMPAGILILMEVVKIINLIWSNKKGAELNSWSEIVPHK